MKGKICLTICLLIAILIAGCTHQERPSTPLETGEGCIAADRVVEQFVDYYNQENATGLYYLHSKDVKLEHSLEDFEAVFAVEGNNSLNVTRYNVFVEENKTLVTANTSAIFGHKSGWMLLTFEVTSDDPPRIDNWVLDRIKRIQEYHGPRIRHYYPCVNAARIFFSDYNDRNAEDIYKDLIDGLKEDHTLQDVRKELDFARRHNVTAVEIETYSGDLVEVEDEVRADITLKFDSKEVNTSTNFSCDDVRVENKIENSSFVINAGFKPMIETWVFDELRKEICTVLALNKSDNQNFSLEGMHYFMDCYGGDGRYSCGFDKSNKEVVCWVKELSEKDELIDDHEIDGWSINVAESIEPPEN